MTPPDMSSDYTKEEFLATVLYRLCRDAESIGVGNTSPIPAAAALLAYHASGGELLLSILGSFKYNKHFTGGIREQYAFACKGRLDVQFFSGGEIDGTGSINLVGVGGYPRSKVRFAGSFGSGLQYYVGRRTILFREEHSPRALVPNVEFVSAPGTSPSDVHRLGGPVALVTGKCVMAFDPERARFRLVSVHPACTVDEVRAATGFDFTCPDDVRATPPPSEEELALLRGFVRTEVAEVYPTFARDCLLAPA